MGKFDGKLTESELDYLIQNNVSEKHINDIKKYLEEYKEYLTCYKDLVGDKMIPEDLFYFSMKHFGYHLKNKPEESIPKENIEARRKFWFKLIKTVAPLFTRSTMIVEDRNKLKAEDNNYEKDNGVVLPDEPMIFVSNHHFRDDVITPLIVTQDKPFYIMFGSIPQLFNSADGMFGIFIGSVLINRNDKGSRKASLEKAKWVMKNGTNIMYYPEGTWNKCPDKLMLDFWPGVYYLAKETGAKVVPIINYVKDVTQTTPKKENPIHIVIDDPIDLASFEKEEGLEYLREVMGTWYYTMMEKYGTSTRQEALGEFDNSVDAWEDSLEKLCANVVVLDSETEHNANYTKKGYVTPEEVFGPIANLEITKENAIEVLAARRLVKENYEANYQKRL